MCVCVNLNVLFICLAALFNDIVCHHFQLLYSCTFDKQNFDAD